MSDMLLIVIILGSVALLFMCFSACSIEMHFKGTFSISSQEEMEKVLDAQKTAQQLLQDLRNIQDSSNGYVLKKAFLSEINKIEELHETLQKMTSADKVVELTATF